MGWWGSVADFMGTSFPRSQQQQQKTTKTNEALTVSEQERIPQFKLFISKETKTMNSESQKNNLRHKGNPRGTSSSETTTKIRKGPGDHYQGISFQIC